MRAALERGCSSPASSSPSAPASSSRTAATATFDQLWLVDADGAAYCSEHCIAMVDDAVWTPPSSVGATV